MIKVALSCDFSFIKLLQLLYFTQEYYSVSQKLKGKAVCVSLVKCTGTNLFVCGLMERARRI